MTFKSPTQPLCRACGKPIPKRTTTVWVPNDQREAITTIADAQRLSNLQVVSISRMDSDIGKHQRRLAKFKGEPLRKSPIRKFSTWDGETYEDEFFCKGPCVKSYAYMMLRSTNHNVVSVAYADALKRQREKASKALSSREN